MLPLADQVSTSLQEYRASIDVSMGGRVAEAIGMFPPLVCNPLPDASGCQYTARTTSLVEQVQT